MSSLLRCCLFALLWSAAFAAIADDAEVAELLDSARAHRQHGRYEEAMEIYDELIDGKVSTPDMALGRADICLATGRWEDAETVLTDAVNEFPDDWKIRSKLAELQFRRGNWDEAQTTIDAVLKVSPDEPLARLIQAHLWTEAGDVAKALEGYRWFVRFYNRKQPTDAETLLIVAEGSVQYARWKSVSQIFDFTLNTLCVDALKADPNCWRSLLISGELLLEKYNRAQGLPELQKGLAINPHAAELHVALGRAAAQDFDWEKAQESAQEALEINPHSPDALQLKAETLLQDGLLEEAESVLKEAEEWNPRDQELLALKAVLCLRQDGFPPLDRLKDVLAHVSKIDTLKLDKPSRFEQIVIQVARQNPKPGYFLAKLGTRLEGLRKHEAAEAVYLQAIQTMPQLSQPKTELGLLYMQTGKTDEAQKILDDAFKSDPFHVRVSNMRKVLKVLDDYELVETEHFVIRADTEFDKLLAQYMAEYLEQVYPELTQEFRYEPPARTQIEVYNKSKGLSAHQWFSARMIGLPWIQTIGASTGMIIAMASPSGLDEPLNWARVLKHEYVHILTLQETEFNIPHWYTEALAVRAEGYSRPAEWNRLLLERVPKGRLRNLDNLNLGFQRSEDRDDWNFSYCQAALYAQYMVDRFGADATAKLLDAYRRQLPTEAAIADAFNVTKSDFEEGYREYIVTVVGGLKTSASEPKMTPAEIAAAYEADSSDPANAGRYAQLLMLQDKADEAQELAIATLEIEPKEPHAALVMAALALKEEDKEAAVRILAQALDEDKPHRQLLEQLAKFTADLEDYTEAARLYDLGREKFPDDPTWWKGTAAMARHVEDTPKLKVALETLCDLDYDSAAWPLQRAEIAMDEKDYAVAKEFGIKALHVDVLDEQIHAILGESSLKLGDPKRAASEFKVGLELKPGDVDLHTSLAECYLELKLLEKAKELLEAARKERPEDERVKALWKRLNDASKKRR
jgi:tetratricopeptide (TPR) repeat protein